MIRGLTSKVAKFRSDMIKLCCDADVAERYARGAISFEEAARLANKYTTTLHATNSAVLKLAKLTRACTVYRGIWGRRLPEVCRVLNEHGFKGGVEVSFISTTKDRMIAIFYASGGADKEKRASGSPAIVFEIRMGMIDRGAEVSWLSQFPHEEESASRALRSPSPSPCVVRRPSPTRCARAPR